jgi:tRNA (guanine37-N1)-methyltransferase
MRIDVITLFPELVRGVAEYSIPARAIQKGLLELQTWNPRDYTRDKHRTVDDRPYGGGPGMVMKVEPLRDAIHAAKQASSEATGTDARVIYLSPQGRRLDQAGVQSCLKQNLVLIAGRYEGVDERLIEQEVDEEWSIGDYVLSGGELPAMVMIDAVARLLPGALGDEDSAMQDSFMNGLLDYPHYTRPEVYAGDKVPEVLLGGNHTEIARWRYQQALGRTWLRRPDMINGLELDEAAHALLEEFKREHKQSNKTESEK